MKTTVKILALILALVLSLGLIACTKNEDETPNDNDDDTVTIDKNLDVNVTVLSGTTGMGMAKLISDSKDGKAALKYKFTVVSDATQISAGIIGGSIDIAAVPTNLASTLYKKTNGGVQVLAINTLGVLYLIENGNTVTDIASLKGKTVYVPGQGTNPEYILKYIIEKNGMKVGEDVIFDYTYNSPDALATAVAGGLASIALLPEPKVTVVKSQNKELRTAIDLTAEWDKVSPVGSLVQGCIIARKEFVDAHKAEINAFLDEYKASVKYIETDLDNAAECIATAGILPKAQIAKAAIPNCNIIYAEGNDMKTALAKFFEILYSVEPKAIGGEIPADGLYYSR